MSQEIEQIRVLMSAAKSPATRRAYHSDWQRFALWCERKHRTALPASSETITFYFAEAAVDHKVATLSRWRCSINRAHLAAQQAPPAMSSNAVFHETFQGIRKTYGVSQRQVKPLLKTDILNILRGLNEDDPRARRDRLILLLGFAGGFRSAELSALRVEHLERTADGLIVFVPTSKTDQQGQGRRIGIVPGRRAETCPIRAYEAWRKDMPDSTGPLFRRIRQNGRILPNGLQPQAFWVIVRQLAGTIDLDPKDFGSHSLRAGLVTQAYLNKVPDKAIMQQTGHRSLTSMQRYIRHLKLFEENASASLGL